MSRNMSRDRMDPEYISKGDKTQYMSLGEWNEINELNIDKIKSNLYTIMVFSNPNEGGKIASRAPLNTSLSKDGLKILGFFLLI